MKKILLMIIIWLLASAFLAGVLVFNDSDDDGSVWFPAWEGGLPAAPEIHSRMIDDSSIELTATFSGIWARLKETEQGEFTEIYLEDFGKFAVLGSPDLPQFTTMLELSTNSSAVIKNVQYQFTTVQMADFNLPGTIIPMQPASPKSGSQQDWVPPDAEIYDTDQFFPQELIQLASPFQQRDHHIQPVQMFPVRYNPVSGETQVIQSITVEIEWRETPINETLQNEHLKNSNFDSLYPEIIKSPLATMDESKSKNSGESYLIISPDGFLDNLSAFILLKQSQGYDVTLASLSEIGSPTTDGIKKYIQNAYDSWENPPVYLLLVGDTNFIPAWLSGTTVFPINSKKTDLYYVTMDGSADFVPDIFYGRLPARDATQLNAMLSKIIAYSQNNGTEEWVKKAAFISTCDSGNYTIPIGSHDYVINSFTTSLGFTGIFPENPQIGGDKLYCRTGPSTVITDISTKIISSINDQRSLVTYSGHGSKTAWYDPSYINISQTTVRNLSDNQITPFVSSFACETGDFGNATTTESFGETWMIQPLKGAIAYLGSADYSYWGPDDKLERILYATLLSNPTNPPPIEQAIFTGLQAVQTYNITYGQYYWETYNLLGDPSTQIWIGPRPSDFALSFPAGNIEMCTGTSIDSTVNVTSNDGFSDPVTLSLLGLPTNVTGQFNPNPTIPSASSTVSFSANDTAEVGDYDMTIHGESDSLSHDLLFQLAINNTLPDSPVQTSPPDASINQSLFPTFIWQAPLQARSFQLQVSTDPEFSNIIIDQEGLITPVFTPTVSLESLTTYYWRVKAFNGCGEGDYSPVFSFVTRNDTGDCEHISDTVVLYENDFESDLSGWTTSNWFLDVGRYLSPHHAYFAQAPGSISDQKLTSPSISIPDTSTNTTLRFWQWRNLEAGPTMCLDGGNLEYSINGGTNWTPISNQMILSEFYDGLVSSSFSNPLGGLYAWCSQKDWVKTVVDVTPLNGEDAIFRFRLGTDSSTGTEGWYVDDFRVQGCIKSYQFSLECSPTEKSALNGLSVTYPILITNRSRPDSYHISFSENVWLVDLDSANTVVLDYNESTSIKVTVFIPFDAIPDSFDTTKITISSDSDNSVKQEIILTTSAIETFFNFFPFLQK